MLMRLSRRRDETRQFIRQLFGFMDQYRKTLRADIPVLPSKGEHDQGNLLIRAIAIETGPGLSLSAGMHELLRKKDEHRLYPTLRSSSKAFIHFLQCALIHATVHAQHDAGDVRRRRG